MKSPRATLAATAIPLLMTSLPLMAGELPFNAPTTAQAKDSAPLLHQTARALNDSPYATSPGKHISNLWLFPTADGETVFARYNLTAGSEATSAAEHLTVLTVRGGRIIDSRELTSVTAEVAGNEPTKLHWSAFIGTGDSARSVVNPVHSVDARNYFDSTRASPDWTASIGTGTAAASNTKVSDTKQTPSLSTQEIAASADWTSKIGTGHAVESGKRETHASMVSSR